LLNERVYKEKYYHALKYAMTPTKESK